MLFVPEPKADDSSGLHFAGCSSEARARARRASMEIRRMRSETSGGKVDYTLLWKFKKCDPPVLPIPAFCSPRAHGHQVHPLRHPRGEAGGRLPGLGQGRDRPHGVSDDRGCSRSHLKCLHLIPHSLMTTLAFNSVPADPFPCAGEKPEETRIRNVIETIVSPAPI